MRGGGKNDVFQHTHPTCPSLCSKEPSIQSIPLVMAPAHLNPPLAHALEDHQPSEGTWHPHSDHTPDKVLQTYSGDSGQHRKGVTAWQVLAKPPSSPLSLGSSAEPSHSTRVSASQPPLCQEQPQVVSSAVRTTPRPHELSGPLLV